MQKNSLIRPPPDLGFNYYKFIFMTNGLYTKPIEENNKKIQRKITFINLFICLFVMPFREPLLFIIFSHQP